MSAPGHDDATTLIRWSAAYSIGVASVDQEHRELIELINAAYRALSDDAAATTVPACLGEIYARISAHFALEEKLMREHRYDRYREHKADHERLLDEIRDIMDDYEDGRCFDRERVAERLQRWFSEHFQTHDARLHRRLGI